MNQILNLGKEIYGSKFKLYPEDRTTWHKLYAYFFEHTELCKMYNLDLQKGLLLIGPVGVGKTSMLNLMNRVLDDKKRFAIKSANEIALTFADEGHSTILKYGKHFTRTASYSKESRALCIDDIGSESNIKHFGNDCNVIQEILTLRYDLYISIQIKSYCTTNLSFLQLGEVYGERLISRFRQMFNEIQIRFDLVDKRVSL